MNSVADSTTEQSNPPTILGHPVGLAGAMGIVIAVALILVGISYLLYLKSPASKYDLARPDRTKSESLISSKDEDTDITSPVTKKTVENNLQSLQKNIKALQNANDFGEQDLSDQNLGLQPAAEPSL